MNGRGNMESAGHKPGHKPVLTGASCHGMTTEMTGPPPWYRDRAWPCQEITLFFRAVTRHISCLRIKKSARQENPCHRSAQRSGHCPHSFRKEQTTSKPGSRPLPLAVTPVPHDNRTGTIRLKGAVQDHSSYTKLSRTWHQDTALSSGNTYRRWQAPCVRSCPCWPY